MPPARTTRQRTVENDENAAPARMTRAKAAAITDEVSAGAVRKALQTKKSAGNAVTGSNVQRKRAALGDLSNVVKNEQVESKEGKKAAARVPLSTKASQNAGVNKLGRSGSNRSALGVKDANKKSAASDLKRHASGSGVMGGAHKKRSTGSSSGHVSIKEASPEAERVEVKAEVETHVEIKEECVTSIEEEAKPIVISEEDEDEVPDLDAEDLHDPLMVAEYAVEIFDYLRELEPSTLANPEYMNHQDHIDWNDRDVLNDWLIQVHQRFQLLPETFYLAINIIDRFLSMKVVQLDKLQLVGITAMFIASKYEEVISPHVSNFTYLAKDYSDSDILSAERFILATLNYDLSYPNPMNFLRRISKADNYDVQTRTIGKYLLEISCLDHRFLEFNPSHVSAAAMYMSRWILDRGDWNSTIAHYAGYTEAEILPIVDLMIDYCTGSIKHEAFHSKYASKKYLKASLLVRQWATRHLSNQRSR